MPACSWREHARDWRQKKQKTQMNANKRRIFLVKALQGLLLFVGRPLGCRWFLCYVIKRQPKGRPTKTTTPYNKLLTFIRFYLRLFAFICVFLFFFHSIVFRIFPAPNRGKHFCISR